MKNCRIALGVLLSLSFLSSCAEKSFNMHDPSMQLFNVNQPLFTKDMALDVAKIIAANKYEKDIFIYSGEHSVEDNTDCWIVTLKNDINDENPLVPKKISFYINKYNGGLEKIR